MAHTRRDILRLAAAVGATTPLLALGGCDDDDGPATDGLPVYEWAGEVGPEALFSHGIASGDPLTDRVILWTRVTTDAEGEVEVFYEVSAEPDFVFRLAAGSGTTSAAQDHTFKVDPSGLPAGATLYYRFYCQGRVSPMGRTRTAPAEGAERVRFAVVSCASLGLGHLHAYRFVSELEIDAVLHLGDYMYEYGNDGGFAPHSGYVPEHECVTLADYRLRYAHYHGFSELQAVHAAHPMICVWDDHEHANDASATGAQNHDDETEGPWSERKLVSTQAWHEWLPVRPQADQMRIYRSFNYGGLAELFMLDARLVGRDAKSANADIIAEPTRTMMGPEQEAWAEAQLKGSTATWKLIGQQVMFAPLLANGINLNVDQWDGYPAARERLLTVIDAVDNVAIFTGDIHSSWANDVPGDAYDPANGAGSRCVEFVTPAISSRSLPFINENLVGILETSNPHIKFFEVTNRGFIVVDVTAERTQSTWCLIPDIEPETVPDPAIAARFEVRAGERHLRNVGVDGLAFGGLRAAETFDSTP
jgi:alkaline phosphatase D